MKYFIKTFGCQMNEADSEKMAALFESQGYKMARKIEDADVAVINTCSVRESAENRVFGLIRNLTRQKGKRQKIILTGCMVGSARGERRRYSLAELKRKLPDVDEFKSIEELIGETQVSSKRKYPTRAFVPVMRGCDHFCSYCVVPYGRGKERSRPFDEIVCEIEELAKRGYKEITLLGQNVNSYGKNLKPRWKFSGLLRRLHQIEGIKRISFITSNPWDLTDDIIEAMSLPKSDRYLHLPVQSGDDEILKEMNRPYTAKGYLDLVKKIRAKIPNIKIGTDLIVGFPGETKKQFENTVKLCQKVGFVKAYIARYSPRPGTAAFKLKDNVPPEEKKRRWQILENLINHVKVKT
ncbi:MAG TPA: MiaB/RimO family radical SAM methylthiotransferase [Nevskiaceae bacterium]|nr:MiaB/RimO family radical SAM methylthiotransferase [Nevskiaceae bacterium]